MLLERNPGLHQLIGGIALPDRPLAGPEHADGRRPMFAQNLLELALHDVEGLRPADGRELALLVVLAVPGSQERRRQPVLPVHDLRQEIAFDAVEAAIDLCLHVAVGRDDAVVLDGDHHAAARAAEAAGRLRPFQLRFVAGDDHVSRLGGQVDPDDGRGYRGGLRLDQIATGHVSWVTPGFRCRGSLDVVVDERGGHHAAIRPIWSSRARTSPSLDVSSVTTIFP